MNTEFHFPCPIYLIDKPEFLESVSAVSEEFLAQNRKPETASDLYPVCMSGNYADDPRIKDFAEFVGNTAWNILNDQGYAMDMFDLTFTEMWTQEHHRQSSMEQHVHGYGALIVGFYFLETPENCSRVIIHDPRSGKVMSDLPQRDPSQATVASQMINFQPKPGMLMFTNSWLPHSFTRNGADTPIKFVHFNLAARPSGNTQVCRSVEVI